jgi:riboflavin synthase
MIEARSGDFSSMFTGIVEAIGLVESIQRVELEQAAVVRLVIGTELPVESLPLGASIAVDGVCLTVVEKAVGHFAADLGPETLALTTLGSLQSGDRVHLERPLRLGDPLGGHMVTGHVDVMGTVVSRRQVGAALELEISAPPTVSRFMAAKGSIAVDGVSLTINTVTGDVASLTLIPHTLEATKLGDKQVGDAVNLEADMIAKHIDRLVGLQLGGDRSAGGHTPRREISIDTLRRYGFVR